MQRASDYRTGWIDTTVHDFLAEIDEPPASMAYALITCLDSSFEVRAILERDPVLKGLAAKTVGKGALITTRRLLAARHKKPLFFGFDEVWFFPNSQVEPKPKNIVITGPDRIASATLAPLTRWMRANGCPLGIGDGVGMNFCARLQGVAKFLVESYAGAETNGAHVAGATA